VSGLIAEAMSWSSIWHSAQRRKYTGDPYVIHCLRVAKLVQEVGGTDDMVAAALLHDTVEDCGVDILDIAQKFNPLVALYVSGLTDVSKPEDGNRAYRKEMDRQNMASQPAEVKTIKLADLIDNTESIVAHDPDFAKVYMAEKALLLQVLGDGNPVLYQRARAILGNYYKRSK